VKYLVLGANGQLGAAFRSLLRDRGQDCLALGHGAADITDFGRLRQVFDEARPDVVINCAAYNQVDRAEEEWRQAFLVNGIAVGGLARLAKEHGSVLVHYSTDYVFDGEKKAPYTIVDLPNPLSRYGESKLLGEEQLKLSGERYFLIRTSWVFGAGNENFVTRLLQWARDRQEIKVATDQHSSPTHTRDLAQATLKLLETGRYGLYHLCSSGACSRYEWAEFVLRQIGWSGRLLPALSKDFDSPAARPQYSVLDSYLYKQLTGEELPDWQEAVLNFLKETGAISA
jgi:dTDP-4-dehydrorhamnose reductase